MIRIDYARRSTDRRPVSVLRRAIVGALFTVAIIALEWQWIVAGGAQ